MIQSAPSSYDKHIGVHLEGVHVQIVESTSLDRLNTSRSDVPCNFSRTPPAALLRTDPDEHILIDAAWPPHPRGMGRDWPPESRFSSSSGVGRFPLAFAWKLIRNKKDWEWNWRGQKTVATPAEAIGSAVAELHQEQRRSSPVLVIPNFTDLDTQQRIIEQVNFHQGSVRLLWRPIAAALAWWETLDKFAQQQVSGDLLDRIPVVVAYLGIDFYEVTLLHLKRDEASGQILPARERPSPHELCDSPAIPGLLNIAVATMNEDCDPTDENVWRLLWTTGFIRDALSTLQKTATSPTSEASWAREVSLDQDLVRRAWGATLRGDLSQLARGICQAWDRFMPCSPRSDVAKWKSSVRRSLESEQPRYAIICGPLASVIDRDGKPLGETLVREIAPSITKAWVEGESLPTGIVANGAAIYAEKQSLGIPTYLDKLPRLRLQVTRQGQAEWLDLLKSDEYVLGGKLWNKNDYDFDLAVKENSAALPLAVDHEEFEYVRELEARLPKKPVQNEKVRLNVEIEPAQGNARIFVRPVNPDAFGRSQVLVNWSTMREACDDKGKPLTPQAYLNTRPLAFPKHQPRACSANLWSKTKIRIREWSASKSPYTFSKVASSLRSKDPAAYPLEATAISSDGMVDPPSEVSLLQHFVDYLLHEVKRPSFIRHEHNRYLRLLGYTSTPDSDHLSRLAKELTKKGTKLTAPFLMSCGWCLRDPGAIKKFAEASLSRFIESHDKVNNWLKAFAEILRYRDDATQEILSPTCHEITRHVLEIFNEERKGRQRPMIFRNAATVIVYLLRRRAFDDSYLDPESLLANQVKNSYREAIADLDAGRLHTIGGTVNLRQTLQNMIDYVDKKGSGLVYNAAADEDDDVDDDE